MNGVPLKVRAAAELELRRRRTPNTLGYLRELVHLPEPTPLQYEILASPAKRKVIACGRRVGKTFEAALESVDDGIGGGILNGQQILFSSASQDQTDVYWSYVRKWLMPLVDRDLVYKNETKRIIELKTNGGAIRVKTASDPDALRSFYADKLLLDECALLAPDVWYEAGAPMLADHDGTAVFYSTPRRRNWFFTLFMEAKADQTGRWFHKHATSYDNPHLSKEALDLLIEDMTEDSYKQEILAEFLADSGSVFRYVDKVAIEHQLEQPEPGRRYGGGLDWGREHDYTALSIWDIEARREVHLDTFNQIGWEVQRNRVAALYERFNLEWLYAESNSIGGPNIEALQAEGLNVYPFETTSASKGALINALALGIERVNVKLLNNDMATMELVSYELERLPSGKFRYGAPQGVHDDTVIARCLALHGIENQVAILRWNMQS